MSPEQEQPKIQIDSDWKAEAQAEKERLAREEEEKAKKRPAGGQEKLPEASFSALVHMLGTQAIMGLGVMTDPKTKAVMIDLEGARFAIDLLGILEEKTRNNLTDNEATELKQVGAELRSRYVQVTQALAESAAARTAGSGPAAAGTAGGTDPPTAAGDPAAGSVLL